MKFRLHDIYPAKISLVKHEASGEDLHLIRVEHEHDLLEVARALWMSEPFPCGTVVGVELVDAKGYRNGMVDLFFDPETKEEELFLKKGPLVFYRHARKFTDILLISYDLISKRSKGEGLWTIA